MISDLCSLNRKIKDSNLEEIYKRLCIPKTDQSFSEILAEFGKEIASNKIFEPYVKNIGSKENEYRQNTDIASILQKATYTPVGQQALDQKMLTRKERISEYFSLWSILRFNELYDISLHERVRNELIAKNDLRDLADFEKGIIVLSDILEGYSKANLADYYLPHAHRVTLGIIQFYENPDNIFVIEKLQRTNTDIKAKDLMFDKTTCILQCKDKKLIMIEEDDTDLILFTGLFFPEGSLSKEKLSLKFILNKLNQQEGSLLPTKQHDISYQIKTTGNKDYEHVRYLKKKLNNLLYQYIKAFIILKKKFYPNPELFQQ